jgi:S1-C subfamily serine protease
MVTESGGSGRMQKARGTGSGAIISSDGYIVTNHHVAGRGSRITIRMSDREELPATLVGTDPLSDLSVLKSGPAARRASALTSGQSFGRSVFFIRATTSRLAMPATAPTPHASPTRGGLPKKSRCRSADSG